MGLEDGRGGFIGLAKRRIERNHQHRIRQAVDGRLRRQLGFDQIAKRTLPIFLDPLGHGVELVGELADLVVADNAGANRDVAFTESPRSLPEDIERTQQPRRHDRRGQQAEDSDPR